MAKTTRKSTAKKPPGGKPAGKSPAKSAARSSAKPNGKPADWVDFNELKKTLAFAAVLDRYGVRLRGAGDQKHGFCPLPAHGGKGDGKKRSPSFSAHLGKKAFHCFGCGASGNPLDFACLMEGRNPDDPAELRRTALELQGDLLGGNGSPAGGPRRAVAARKAPDPTSDAPDAENAQGNDPGAGDEETDGEEGAEAKPRVVNAPLDFTLKLDPTHPYLPRPRLLARDDRPLRPRLLRQGADEGPGGRAGARRRGQPRRLRRPAGGRRGRGRRAPQVAVPRRPREGRRDARVPQVPAALQRPPHRVPPPRPWSWSRGCPRSGGCGNSASAILWP